MAEDALEIADIEHIVLTGKMFRKLTDDPRGIRYTLIGETTDRRIGYVVCRFLDSGILLIIPDYYSIYSVPPSFVENEFRYALLTVMSKKIFP